MLFASTRSGPLCVKLFFIAMPRNTKIILVFAIAAALLAIVGSIANNFWLIVFCKPLATALLLAFALINWNKVRKPFVFCICIGLLFSLFGDVLLMWPEKLFVAGLAAFLLAHLAYLAAFTRDAKFPANWLVWLAFLAIAAANFFVLRPNLPSGLALPVAVYSVALGTMTAQALGRFLLLRNSAATLAAIGAVFFLLSDTLLAWDRFHTALFLAPALILIPYYIAQLLLALSTEPSSPTSSSLPY
jgi:uncharacterized membrane protein YhhN